MKRVLLLLLWVPAFAGTTNAHAAEAIATFAGGCFWCTESDFEKVPGVTSAVSGYTGGRVPNPDYAQVSDGGTGHAEAVEVRFDPAKVSYEQLLKIYWRSVDPTVKDRQFCDAGNQYRTAIFTHDAEQRRLAEKTKAEVAKQLAVTVHTEIADAGIFYPAEDYHQDYYKKNPIRYKFYRANCGRDARLEQIWGQTTNSKN
jgi:peptide-methionine (S)-S-oxide reductase